MSRLIRCLIVLSILASPNIDGQVLAVARRNRQSRTVGNPSQSNWWMKAAIAQGPNVCVSERTEKISDKSRRFGRPWTKGNFCGQSTILVFECCEGYDIMPQEQGCAGVRTLDTLATTLTRSGPQILTDFLNEVNLVETLTSGGPYTIFAPTGRAFQAASDDVIASINKSISTGEPNTSLLYYHVIEGRITEEDFLNNMMLPTLLKPQRLRINKFRNGLLTVNCIPLVNLNREATNGIIHTVESIILPDAQNSITDVLVRESQFSRFATVLVKARMTSLLRADGPFTILAPTNEALDAMPQQDFEAIFADADALSALLRYHILEGIWCSTSIMVEREIPSILEGSMLEVTCNDSKPVIGGAQVIQADIAATNGFIHVIDSVLIPRRAKSLAQISEELELTELLLLANLSGLHNMLVNSARFTIFAPTNEAIQALPNDTLHEILSNPSSAYGLLMGHVITGTLTTRNFADRQLLQTLAQMPLQVNIFPQRILVSGATILSANNLGRNGVVHVIDKVVIPPTKSIGETLIDHASMNLFVNALNHSDETLLGDLTNLKGPYTVFAPDDMAFAHLPALTIERMLADTVIVTRIMKNHILDEEIFTNSLLPKAYYRFQTRHGRILKLREDTGIFTAGIAIIKEPNIMCSNGVIHIVDRVIQFD